MQKKLILIFFIKSIFLFAQIKDTKTFDLTGNVKEVKYYKNNVLTSSKEFNKDGFITRTTDYINDKAHISSEYTFDNFGNKIIAKDEFYTLHYEYDEQRNIVQITDLKTHNGDTVRVEKNEYIGKNLVKTIIYKFSEGNKKVYDKILYEYNLSNKLIKEVNYGISNLIKNRPYRDVEDKSPIIYTYNYDESSNLIEKIGKTENGEITSKYSYKYDSKNNKIEYRKEWKNNSASGYETYVYDDKNNLIEIANYTINDELIYKDIYTFDETGNQLSRAHYFKNVITSLLEYKYDSKKNKIEEREYQKGKLCDTKIRIFDIYGNEIGMEITDSNGKILFNFKREITYY